MSAAGAARLRAVLLDAGADLRADLRSQALTVLGIVWGSAAVLLLLSFGAGFRGFLDLGVEKTGDRWVAVVPAYTTREAGGRSAGRPLELDLEDVEHLAAAVPSARAVAAEGGPGFAVVESPDRTRITAVTAASAALGRIQAHRLARGRWYDEADDRQGRRVAVLGAHAAQEFFPDGEPLGSRLRIGGETFVVIGVLEEKGFQLVTVRDLHDNTVFVPLRPGLRVFGEREAVRTVYLEAHSPAGAQQLIAEARADLWRRHALPAVETDAFRFHSIPGLLRPVRRVLAGLHATLGVIGAASLAIAGVGVSNRMTALAAARRRELALRRACGARRRDVQLQVVVETFAVVGTGGVAGMLLGLGGVGGLALLPLPPEIPAAFVSPPAVALSAGVLAATGLAAGLGPSRTAARVEPARVLREA